jgi:hypothetical protein
MPVFTRPFRQELLEYANLCESAKIDAAWIAGIRKSWKQVIDPVKRLAARVPHHETRIDISKLYTCYLIKGCGQPESVLKKPQKNRI